MKKGKRTLTASALADGHKSGLTKADMLKLGLYSLDEKEMYAQFGIAAEGLVFPYDKSETFRRVKIINYQSKFGEELKRKYTQGRNTGSRLYLPNIGSINWKKVAASPMEPLLITEGEKKAAAACKAGFNCIGLGGVSCYKIKGGGLLPDWNQFVLQGRKVLIVFDSDIVDKRQVRNAEYKLSLELEARGAEVMRVRLPDAEGDDKVGLDDFLADNDLLKSPARARVAFEKLPRETIEATYMPHLTELGNSIRMAEEFRDHLRFVPKWKEWIICDKQTAIWKSDEDGEVMRCAKQIPYIIRDEAKKTKNIGVQEGMMKWSAQSEKGIVLRETVNLAKSESELIVRHAQLDANIWEIAFPNGLVMNLQSRQIRQIQPEDYFTKKFGTSFDPKATCPRFEKFIDEVFDGNKELVKFFQTAIGWCLSGDMSEQCFFILYGTGANGKGTLLNTLLALFGDYGRQASPRAFMAKKNDSDIRSDLARLVGVRFISTSETEEYQRLAESLIKQWTGEDQISIRDLYIKNFEFVPQGKIFLATNHKPNIYGNDHGIWRRVVLLPFTRKFTIDDTLRGALLKELPGILNWALRGFDEWMRNRLIRPKCVNMAIDAYREEMDVIGAWLEENCEIDLESEPPIKELVGSLHLNYTDWAKSAEEYCLSKKDFSRKMVDRGFKRHQTSNRKKGESGRYLLGVKLKEKPRKF